jgi:hypothetical protein
MRLQEYGRNPHQRKAHVHHPALLLVGGDVSQAKHQACIGTQTTMRGRQLDFTHTREGFGRFAQTRTVHLVTNGRQHILSAMAPSGLSWQALDEPLNSWGYAVGWVHCHAVRNNRKPRLDGTRQTEAKDAARAFGPWTVLWHARLPTA